MRESIGSTFLFQIMIVFIFFFVAFLAIAINYAQAFRTKNQIINAIEQAEGYNETSKERIAKVTQSSGYFREVNCSTKAGTDFIAAKDKSGNELKGVCIKHNQTTSASSTSGYYTVMTFIHFDFPIIGDIATIPVTGETKLIVNDNFSN